MVAHEHPGVVTMTPGLDLVVVSYRTPADLDAFMVSLVANPPSVDWSVTIVNVAPTEADRAAARLWSERLGDRCLIAIETATNVGYGAAANRGATIGNREVLAIFNADVEFFRGVLDECYEAILTEPSWGVLGPRQVDGRNGITAAGIFGTPEQPRHRGWRELDRGQYSDIRDDAVYVAGSAMFVRRHTWLELACCPSYQRAMPGSSGALLETPQLYFEDSWLSRHAAAHGYANVYLGSTRLVHYWHRSFRANKAPESMKASRELFRQVCDAHDPPIAHE